MSKNSQLKCLNVCKILQRNLFSQRCGTMPKGPSLWESWKSGRFRLQTTWVRIQPSPNYYIIQFKLLEMLKRQFLVKGIVKWVKPGLLLIYFVLFKHKFYIKTENFCRIRTWIVGVEGEHADHLTHHHNPTMN